MPNYLADDFADIARRMNEITKEDKPGRWGLWSTRRECWLRQASDGSGSMVVANADTATVFLTEADAAIYRSQHGIPSSVAKQLP